MNPVNSIEIALRKLITVKTTPVWSFFTPLATAPLWVIVKHYPELDGSGEVAPDGGNPPLCVFTGPEVSYIGLYTSPVRAEAAFERWNISRHEMTINSAMGYQILKYASTYDAHLYMNLGVDEWQYALDPDLVEILLSRPEPVPPAKQPPVHVKLNPAENPAQHLGPLRDFLRQQPTVRAAWIFGMKPLKPIPAGHRSFDVSLVMQDPEDKSLVETVTTMAKALTPVEMEWSASTLMADDRSLRNLSKKQRPFYEAANFLKQKQRPTSI